MSTPSREACDRYGIFGVGAHLVAVPCTRVEEMFVLSEVHRPAGMGPLQRGVASLRGRTMAAVDLRLCMGLPSARQELQELLDLLAAREEDHRNWLSALQASVEEGKPFTLATDPRRCKFGQWYYAFRTDDPVLRMEMARFEEPHAAIHEVALEVARLQARGESSRARAAVHDARAGVLARLIELFDGARRAVRAQQREIGVTVSVGARHLVLAVDRAEAVTDLACFEGDADPISSGLLRADFVSGLASWRERKEPVLLLDVDRLVALA